MGFLWSVSRNFKAHYSGVANKALFYLLQPPEHCGHVWLDLEKRLLDADNSGVPAAVEVVFWKALQYATVMFVRCTDDRGTF